MIPLGRQSFYDCISFSSFLFFFESHLRLAKRSVSTLFIVARIIIFLVIFGPNYPHVRFN